MTPITPADVGALFVPDGGRFVPTEYARGPWSPDSLHGGPVAALLAGTVDAQPADEPMHVARLTVELLRPVPLAPLTLSCTVPRPGRKVQLVEAVLSDGRRDLAWGRALRLRLQPTGAGAPDLPDPNHGPVPGRDPDAPAGPDDGHDSSSPTALGHYRAFHNAGAELRYVTGSFTTLGPATVWVRLAVPVVAGEEPSPLQRVAAAADFGNGVSAELDFGRFLFINPDLTVNLVRPAVGAWVCLDAVTRIGIPGVGLAECRLFDVLGPIGRSTQSLLVEPRP